MTVMARHDLPPRFLPDGWVVAESVEEFRSRPGWYRAFAIRGDWIGGQVVEGTGLSPDLALLDLPFRVANFLRLGVAYPEDQP